MSPLFRRASADDPAPTSPAEPPQAGDEPAAVQLRKGQQPKGRPTPKRRDASRRRAPEPPPKSNKEARQRMREKMKAERAERYEGMRRGDERYLLPRDRGPVRRLVRDLIDSRRNVGPLFFAGVLVVVVLSYKTFPPIVNLAATMLWFGLVLLFAVDAFIIARLVRKAVRARFPDTNEKMFWLVLYGVLRSLSFRQIRNPKPQVKPGDAV